ncbi:S-layer homology domain-containing protein [Paenibacillus tritici]|uniref:S-layer homology domain-containing protein n=1 Tax=Paenibacillus tritici TaxID=1873425 RepID=UPI001BA8943E|nr:S-layer homology domain-containing protein [Paenibacillus tritici]QUL56028.1 S-layer homology domain-containing protein [Paenibacillus tritici]
MKNKSFQMRTAKITLACSILASTVTFGASASAFSDLKGHASESKINALHQEGILNGVTSDKFAPKSKLTYAQGLQFIVSGLKLSPQNTSGKQAGDYFDKVKNTAWYAPAFLTAKESGLPLDRSIDPNAVMTRIQFAHLLLQTLQNKGDFAYTERYAEISDGGKLSAAEMNSLQILVNTRLIALEKNNTFRPNEPVTRAEAAVWVYDAAKFAKEVINMDNSNTAPAYTYEAAVKLDKAATGVNKATVTVSNLPNPGYGLFIERIEFGADHTAVIYFRVTKPAPGSMNPQVISAGTAVTYLPEGYTAVAQPVAGQETSTTPPVR